VRTLIQHFAHKPRQIFLVDGIGALVSAFLLLGILLPLQAHFGMPRHILLMLGLLAVAFAVYSFSCYSLLRRHRILFIKIISLTNLSYCALTLGLVIYHINSLSILGISYFFAEMLVICLLVWVEWQTAVLMSRGIS
jgi:hypothetical protein